MANKETEDLRTLLIRTNKETFKIQIPATWKVTFSNFNPGSPKNYGDSSTALRIYEATDKQRACFLGVIEFRDLSIPFERKVTRLNAKTKLKQDENGSRYERDEDREDYWIEEEDIKF